MAREGVVSSVSGDSVKVSYDGADPVPLNVAPNADIKLNGKTVTLGELRAGDTVRSSGDPATAVTATGKR